jgi:restriction system protein
VVDLWPVLAIGCVALIGLVWYADKKRIEREVAEMTGAASSTSPSSAKTWKESVAESVARTQASTASPNRSTTSTGRPASFPTSAGTASRAVGSTASGSAVPAVFTELTYELLDRLEWKRLELITELYFRQTGVRAECTCIGPDGGIDVQLYRPGEKTPFSFVQCKAMSWKVDVKLMRELCGVMASAKVSEGVFITTGRYSRDALEFAAKNNIRAISGHAFVTLFNQLPREARVQVLGKVTEGDYTTPTCSRCDIKMVLKDSIPPIWNCRRCNHRLKIRNTRLAALRAARA